MAAIGPAYRTAAFALITGAVFLGSFLLFLVQPVIAKLLLPRFGGSASVWATCLVFFQSALLAGYAYADLLVRGPAPALQRVHVALLLGSLLLLPITPALAGAGSASAHAPALQVLGLLLVGVGLPFVLLATTSPLLQSWTAQLPGTRNPYRLFALSNLASLFALAGYPWLIEPWLTADRQAALWSWAYAAYVALICAAAWARGAGAQAPAAPTSCAPTASPAPGPWRTASWTALAAIASFALVAVTNHLTQNMPSFPLMWVLPLVIYLVTFVLCFDNDRWYRPRAFAALTLVALGAMAWMLLDKRLAFDLAMQSLVFLPALFIACMLCHGELAASRPAAAHLSRFYLGVAAGGAIGGALVGLAAPLLLPDTFEVELSLVLLATALAWRVRGRAWTVVACIALLGAIGVAGWRVHESTRRVVALDRNFYGVLRVREYGTADTPGAWQRTLAHGGILHGQQYLAPERRPRPTSYYTASSGVGLALTALGGRPLHVGVVGLGVGTLAAHGRHGDRYTFFEIDPAIEQAARAHFTYLADTPAEVAVVLGDGRLSLQRSVECFDLLAIDAFSGDSIPTHLLTREAISLYAQRTCDDGIVALHVSNRFLDLKPVVARIAEDLGLHAALIDDPEEAGRPDKASSDWILLAKSPSALERAPIAARRKPLPPSGPQHLWTDGFSHIVAVLRRDRMFSF